MQFFENIKFKEIINVFFDRFKIDINEQKGWNIFN